MLLISIQCSVSQQSYLLSVISNYRNLHVVLMCRVAVLYSSSELWASLDESIAINQASTSNSIVILQSYLEQGNIARKECPLRWWDQLFSSLRPLAKKYKPIPATSVPSEHIFSKPGEMILLKHSRLKNLKFNMIMLLNKAT